LQADEANLTAEAREIQNRALRGQACAVRLNEIVLRADGGLMPHAVPELCALVFELRVGQGLRTEPSPEESTTESVARRLLRDVEEEIDADAAYNAAVVITGRDVVPAWERAGFELRQPGGDDDETDDTQWTEALRLNRMLMHVAREAWQIHNRPPGPALRGLLLLCGSVHGEIEAKPKKRAASKAAACGLKSTLYALHGPPRR
jgi:hypothetical protein